ncbi:hypothetical protein [Parafrankia sp. EUN1f]|uniref:hypothetical protein n=1 Tax=Parafrankia sp. EUN1f TaxID=102897 RepID=UPI0001C44AA5|nr:hypothetical protein [Parafrankia sp. EUN1f]EFC84047.1 hypothetical protein FrEUN1fDRAFT_2773 [Parafrankia sp. EUN1f]
MAGLLPALVPHLVHAARKTPLVGGTGLAVLIAAGPFLTSAELEIGQAAIVLPIVAVTCALAVAFVLDVRAAPTTVTRRSPGCGSRASGSGPRWHWRRAAGWRRCCSAAPPSRSPPSSRRPV